MVELVDGVVGSGEQCDVVALDSVYPVAGNRPRNHITHRTLSIRIYGVYPAVREVGVEGLTVTGSDTG